MTRQTERENFLLTMQTEGVPADVARLVMRHAATLHRLAELQCSSEAYDRDRVPCPGAYDMYKRRWAHGGASCLCRDYGSYSESPAYLCPCTNRYQRGLGWTGGHMPDHACKRCHGTSDNPHGDIPRGALCQENLQARVTRLLAPYCVTTVFQGDPRGAVVKLRVPSGKTDDWGRTGVCVP